MRLRCDYCRSTYIPGEAICQVCEARLPGVQCLLCNFENPPDHLYCGGCGQALTIDRMPEPPAVTSEDAPDDSSEQEIYVGGSVSSKVSENQPKETTFDGTSVPVEYVIGFGAILAVASAAYPWYFLGDQAEFETIRVSIFHQFTSGWDWFPGLPLILIVLSSSLATFLSTLAQHGKASPVPAIFLGLISLISSLWLWQGLLLDRPNPGELELAPMLATIGAIIVLVGGSLMARRFFSR